MFWWQPFCALKQQSVVCPQFCYFPHFSAACNLLLLQSFISGFAESPTLEHWNIEWFEICWNPSRLHFRLCVLSCFEFQSGMIGNMGRPEQPWRTGHSQGLGKIFGQTWQRTGSFWTTNVSPIRIKLFSKYFCIFLYTMEEGYWGYWYQQNLPLTK